MPELPEVETTRRGIEPYLTGRRVASVTVREPRLRWPVPPSLPRTVRNQAIRAVRRRAKYLLLDLERGTLIMHLGMSGNLRVVPGDHPLKTHDHLDLVLDDGNRLRFNDPRRFGSVHWAERAETHPLLSRLGPEPLSEVFDGDWLRSKLRGRRSPIKIALMDASVVVGVGNIYASEALFRAGIHPLRAAGRISAKRLQRLAESVKHVLAEAIEAGGTTLRDFYGGDGKPGYFQFRLDVYGRAGEPCRHCGMALAHKVIGQRASFYCPRCQR